MGKKIILGYGEATKIARDFDVSRVSVYRALSYNDKGMLKKATADMIRKVAVERGGIPIEYQRQ